MWASLWGRGVAALRELPLERLSFRAVDRVGVAGSALDRNDRAFRRLFPPVARRHGQHLAGIPHQLPIELAVGPSPDREVHRLLVARRSTPGGRAVWGRGRVEGPPPGFRSSPGRELYGSGSARSSSTARGIPPGSPSLLPAP